MSAEKMYVVDVDIIIYKSFGENTDHINKWLRNNKITRLYTHDWVTLSIQSFWSPENLIWKKSN